ncbi:hypothetical protein [Streptomyces sp. NPDC127038]|uniref:hypothetical protein n=1 Tax=Streptomyces sp. NPDC127038 TaxID=3347114 RepID=UPI00365AB0D3
MSDDARPDNVLTLPRIGSAPPPDLPPAPDLSAPAPADPGEGGGVRISPWDAPDIPHAPAAPDGAAVLRSEGADPPGPPDAGAPRAGALSLAAILAIALAAFEGMQTWVKEAVPLRAEAARHRRELELLAAKATADAHRLGAEATGVRRRGVPSGHDYGRSVLGSGSGGRGRGGTGAFGRGTGTGPGARPGSGRGSTPMASHTGPGRTNGPGRGGGMGSGSSGSGSGRGTFGGSGNSSRGGTGSGNGSRGGGSWGGTRGGGAGAGGGASGASGGNAGRRSAGRKIADWWSKGKQNSGNGGPSGGKGASGAHSAATKDAVRNAVRAAKKGGPTFWEATGDKPSARWKGRTGPVGGGSGRAPGTGPGPVNTGWTPGGRGGRTTFWQAVHETIGDRWTKRRDDWKASGGPRRQRTGPRKPSAPDPGSTGTGRPSGDPNAGPSSGEQAWRWARASAFDTEDPVTVTVEQAGPARAHGTRWEPTPIAPARPQLPRAPQRPAGTRPGTTQRRDFPMPPSASGSVQVTAPPANAMAGRHATEINLDGAVGALARLTMAGMETYDDAQALAMQARRLLSELEAMGTDLAVTHNVLGPRTVRSFTVLLESVGMLVVNATRTAKAALAAAELAEAEETAMERDYRPTQTAAADAGLTAPSARIHNEN